jgi:hypothetical protein
LLLSKNNITHHNVALSSLLFALTLIFLLGFVSRLVNITAEDVWVDEGFSYWAIRHDDMLRVIINDVHPPIYFIGLRLWAGLVGISELSLRYFSLLPSLISIAVIYRVAIEVQRLRGASIGYVPLIASLLFAIADMETYMSQTIRMYTWHVLWVLFSMWFFLRWVRLGRRADLILWTVANITLLYTQYLGLATIGAQAFYVLLFMPNRQRLSGLGAIAFACLTFVPWGLEVVAGQTANVGTGFNVPSTLASLWAWRIEWFTGQWALTIGLALFGIALLIYNKNAQVERVRFPHRANILIWGWLLVPVIGAYVLNFFTPILMDYRLTQITPAVVLLIALGLGNLRGKAQAFLVIVIVVYGVTTYDTPRPRPKSREIAEDIARYVQPDDLAIAHITPSGDWHMVYYYELLMPDIERRSLRQWQLEQPATYQDGLPELLSQHAGVWFVHWSSDQSAFEALERAGHTQTVYHGYDWLGSSIDLYRFDQLPNQPLTQFENGLTLVQAIVDGERGQIQAWWGTDAPLEQDYIISAIVLNEHGQLIAQHDGQPFNGERPTSTFNTGEIVYDPHIVQPVENAPPAQSLIFALKVYRFNDDGTVQDIPTQDGQPYFIVSEIPR